ncbi:MAG: GIY-YIG nuclease family protein [Planctomycetaceae bacterium]|jgi:hypothetical protein|nr:GIY-YIG nuclease family protein [Planctomycetaceae bacterium]
MSDQNIVYILTNQAMPGLVKIGITTDDVQNRIGQLNSQTGVPLPFEVYYAAKVASATDVEKALHFAFGPDRINPKREFFKIAPERAAVLLRLLQQEDITTEVEQEAKNLDPESAEAAEQYARRRPNLNFDEMGVPVDSILTFSRDETKTCTVISDRKVRYNDNEFSLTALTTLFLQGKVVQPTGYWLFNGKSLKEIYDETYTEVE